MITTRTITPEQLSHNEFRDWERIVRHNPALSSPFFQPGFTQAVGRVRTDVRIIVAEADGVPIAFLPFQYGDNGEAVAIGASFNDFQGIASESHAHYSVNDVLKKAGINRMFCPKLLDWQGGFESFAVAEDVSPYIDLSAGYAAWQSRMRKNKSSQLKELARKERKLLRTHGAVRFEYHTNSREVLRQLIDWKRNQYLRTNEKDALALQWTNELLYDLLATSQSSGLEPALSAMYAGDTLIAANYGLSAPGVYHSWLPSYNPEFAVYSPGKLLLLRILSELPERGIHRFDFGKGDERYKFTFATDVQPIRRVLVDRNWLRRWLRANLYCARMAVKSSSIGPRVRELRNRLRSLAAELRSADSRPSSANNPVGSSVSACNIETHPNQTHDRYGPAERDSFSDIQTS